MLSAARQGFEPQLPGPEPGVLPLDDRALRFKNVAPYCQIFTPKATYFAPFLA